MARIVCIDDDCILINALGRSLRTHGVELQHLEHVAEFLKKPVESPFDLALIDLNMADSDGVVWKFAGLQAIKAVRLHCGPTMPIYVFTGQTNNYVIGSSGMNGANGYLEKLGSIDALTEQVIELLNAIKMPEESERGAEIA